MSYANFENSETTPNNFVPTKTIVEQGDLNLNSSLDTNISDQSFKPQFDRDQMISTILMEYPGKYLNLLIESFFEKYFTNMKEILFWDFIPSININFSKTQQKCIPEKDNFFFSCFKNDEIFYCKNRSEVEDSFGLIKYFSENDSIIIFPIISNAKNDHCCIEQNDNTQNPEIFNGKINPKNVIGFVTLVRNNQMGFSSDEIDVCRWFIEKMKLILNISNYESQFNFPIEMMQLMRTDHFFFTSCLRITNSFFARKCEIWIDHKKDDKGLTRFSETKDHFSLDKSGIIGHLLKNTEISGIFNIKSNQQHHNYDSEVDHQSEESILVYIITTDIFHECTHVITRSNSKINLNSSSGLDNSILDSNLNIPNKKIAIVLRGSERYPIFTNEDIKKLEKFGRIIALSYINSKQYTLIDDDIRKNKLEKEGLTALLDVAEEISCQLDTEHLTETIIEKGRLLTNADRCSLFLVNDSHDRLITTLQTGLKQKIDISIDCGIVGKTVLENRAFNIADAYQSEYFDPSTDKNTGYRTRQLLSVPIHNNRGEVIGVTEMVNRLDNKPFTSWDEDIINIFNIFCGISLENAKLYQKSVFMSAQLRSFMNMSFSMSKEESVHQILSDILQNARRSIKADNASLFLVDEAEDCLRTFIVDGAKKCDLPATISLKTGIAAECANKREEIIVNDCYQDPRFNRTVDANNGFVTKSVLTVPLLKTDGALLGVAEMINKKDGSFTNDDLNIIRSFATFASIALENSRLKDVEKYGSVESEISRYITDFERPITNKIPQKLKFVKKDDKERLLTINCFSCDYKGLGHIKTIFYFFHKFKVCETFQISNEMLFRFIYSISKSYNDVPYHNFTHACDVLQFLSYEIHIGNLDQIFTTFEIFALLVSAVCHDANHNGYNNIYNIKSETPLGILFKDQSVMETHHCTVTINILENDDTNLFYSLNKEEQKRIWNIVIKLILATDMAVHFTLVKTVTELLDRKEFNIENEQHRQYAMNLLLKVADISNVSRPFEIADKWCSILSEENFRQGDKEKENGIEYSSPLNDRSNVDRPKSQIGFYNFICLPLYQIVGRIFPELHVNFDHVKENLVVWMEMSLANKKKEENNDEPKEPNEHKSEVKESNEKNNEDVQENNEATKSNENNNEND